MKKKLLAMALCGMLAVSFAVPVSAAAVSGGTEQTATEQEQALPDSVLYYGEVKEAVKDEDGNIIQLRMESEQYGEYVFNIAEDTVWVDSGSKKALDPADVKAGDRLYVFHSLVETRSIPPQSPAFAVVGNVPMDVGCAQYYEVEGVSQQNGKTWIQTSNGGLYIVANEKTEFSYYGSDKEVSADDLQAGGHIVAWTGVNATSYPAQTNGFHIMILPSASWEPLTQGALNQMLGKKSNAASAASSENGGAMTREQLVTALWKSQGSPRVTDDVLDKAEDADEISSGARRAMAWACREGLVSDTYLGPKDPVTVGEAKEMLRLLEEK